MKKILILLAFITIKPVMLVLPDKSTHDSDDLLNMSKVINDLSEIDNNSETPSIEQEIPIPVGDNEAMKYIKTLCALKQISSASIAQKKLNEALEKGNLKNLEIIKLVNYLNIDFLIPAIKKYILNQKKESNLNEEEKKIIQDFSVIINLDGIPKLKQYSIIDNFLIILTDENNLIQYSIFDTSLEKINLKLDDIYKPATNKDFYLIKDKLIIIYKNITGNWNCKIKQIKINQRGEFSFKQVKKIDFEESEYSPSNNHASINKKSDISNQPLLNSILKNCSFCVTFYSMNKIVNKLLYQLNLPAIKPLLLPSLKLQILIFILKHVIEQDLDNKKQLGIDLLTVFLKILYTKILEKSAIKIGQTLTSKMSPINFQQKIDLDNDKISTYRRISDIGKLNLEGVYNLFYKSNSKKIIKEKNNELLATLEINGTLIVKNIITKEVLYKKDNVNEFSWVNKGKCLQVKDNHTIEIVNINGLIPPFNPFLPSVNSVAKKGLKHLNSFLPGTNARASQGLKALIT